MNMFTVKNARGSKKIYLGLLVLVMMDNLCACSEKEEDSARVVITKDVYSSYSDYTREYIEENGYQFQTQEEFDNGELAYDVNYKLALISNTYNGYYMTVSNEKMDDGTENSEVYELVIVGYLDGVDPNLNLISVDGAPVDVVDGKFVFSRLINWNNFIENSITIV